MNELQVKNVPFLGTELMAAQDAAGQVWAGVRWICDGIGMSRNQRDNQIEKVKTEKVLSKGAGNFPLPTRGGKQEVLCLKLDYVPLWLAKITITPTMEQETPEVAERLEQYQLRAKDVLAAAFLPRNKRDPMNGMLTEAKVKNARARAASVWVKLAQANPVPEYQQICAHYASAELTGGEAVLPLPEVREHLYTAAQVGDMLGITGNAVGRLANKHGLKTPEYGKMVWDKSPNSPKQVETFRYNQKAVEKLKALSA